MADGYIVNVCSPAEKNVIFILRGTLEEWNVDGRMTKLLMRFIYTHGPVLLLGAPSIGVMPETDSQYARKLDATRPLPGYFYVRNHNKNMCYHASTTVPRPFPIPSALVSLICGRWESENWYMDTVSIVKAKNVCSLDPDSPVWARSRWKLEYRFVGDFIQGDRW